MGVWDKMFNTYMDILDVYNLTEVTLGPHVSLFNMEFKELK